MEEKLNFSVDELKNLMRENPQEIDKELIRAGEKTVAVYFDPNYGPNVESYRQLKIKMLRTALNDLMSGGYLLKTRKIGFIFKDNRLSEYNIPYNEMNPAGQVAGSISLKVMRAFDGYRTKTEEERALDEEHRNAAVYYLIYLLSKNEP